MDICPVCKSTGPHKAIYPDYPGKVVECACGNTFFTEEYREELAHHQRRMGMGMGCVKCPGCGSLQTTCIGHPPEWLSCHSCGEIFQKIKKGDHHDRPHNRSRNGLQLTDNPGQNQERAVR